MKLLLYIINICMYTYFTEVSYHGMWAVLNEIQEPELPEIYQRHCYTAGQMLHPKNTLELFVDGSSGH